MSLTSKRPREALRCMKMRRPQSDEFEFAVGNSELSALLILESVEREDGRTQGNYESLGQFHCIGVDL